MHSTPYTVLVLLGITLINGLPFTDDDDHEQADQQMMLGRGFFSCYAWYLTQGNPNDLLAKTVKPPCQIPSSFPSTLLGGWTVDPSCDASKQPNTCSYHQGAHGCFRNALKTTGPGAQACYDTTGQWISDPWKGAGTLDAETPLGDLIQQGIHAVVDVLPYYSCCKTIFSPQPKTCNLYYRKRPPGQCENKPAV